MTAFSMGRVTNVLTCLGTVLKDPLIPSLKMLMTRSISSLAPSMSSAVIGNDVPMSRRVLEQNQLLLVALWREVSPVWMEIRKMEFSGID